ncbi:hypothetical protein ACFQ22_11815 [Lentilactobacillus raoultii]|uniref:Uncharacterized protein n=1 Tax=Lentilactobacillus raoultii TaxID=1987503 RepID=A0ABW3PPX4_9LACO|nr:hypothetical protein [Lentilactobacillus raoultii]
MKNFKSLLNRIFRKKGTRHPDSSKTAVRNRLFWNSVLKGQ